MRQINFINEEALRHSRQMTLRRLLQYRLLAGLLIVVMLTGGLTGYDLYLKRQINQLNGLIIQRKTDIKNLSQVESMVMTVADRVKQTKKIVDRTTTFGYLLSLMEKVEQAGGQFDDLKIGMDNKVVAELKCLGEGCAVAVDELLQTEKEAGRLREVTYPSVSYTTTQVAMTINLK